MNSRDFLECNDCVSKLDEFIDFDGTTDTEIIEALHDYTLFLELKQLKKFQNNHSQTKFPSTENPFRLNPFNTTITC